MPACARCLEGRLTAERIPARAGGRTCGTSPSGRARTASNGVCGSFMALGFFAVGQFAVKKKT